MKLRERARETYAFYMSMAAIAVAKAGEPRLQMQRERWIAAAKIWRALAADLREVWGGRHWPSGHPGPQPQIEPDVQIETMDQF